MRRFPVTQEWLDADAAAAARRSGRDARAAALALLALALLGAPAPPRAPRASLPDIEDEVMCLECGTALNVSNSDVADQEREFIARADRRRARPRREIKAALVAEYGPRVLAEPADERLRAHGLARAGARRRSRALALVVLTARRWRRARPAPARRPRTTPALDPDDARRLDAELAAFDR